MPGPDCVQQPRAPHSAQNASCCIRRPGTRETKKQKCALVFGSHQHTCRPKAAMRVLVVNRAPRAVGRRGSLPVRPRPPWGLREVGGRSPARHRRWDGRGPLRLECLCGARVGVANCAELPASVLFRAACGVRAGPHGDGWRFGAPRIRDGAVEGIQPVPRACPAVSGGLARGCAGAFAACCCCCSLLLR